MLVVLIVHVSEYEYAAERPNPEVVVEAMRCRLLTGTAENVGDNVEPEAQIAQIYADEIANAFCDRILESLKSQKDR